MSVSRLRRTDRHGAAGQTEFEGIPVNRFSFHSALLGGDLAADQARTARGCGGQARIPRRSDSSEHEPTESVLSRANNRRKSVSDAAHGSRTAARLRARKLAARQDASRRRLGRLRLARDAKRRVERRERRARQVLGDSQRIRGAGGERWRSRRGGRCCASDGSCARRVSTSRSRHSRSCRQDVRLTIVGDGPVRADLAISRRVAACRIA